MDGAIDYKRILKNFENLPLNEQYLALQEASAAQVKLAGFKPNPEISIGVENFMGSSPYKWLNTSETTLQISQDLQLFGRKNANINYAQSFSQTSKLQLEIAKQEFAKQLAIYWLEYEYAHTLKLLASEFLSATQNDLNIVSLLVEGGREPELRKLQAQDDVTNVNATLLNAQSRIVEAKSAIKAFAQYDGVIDNAKFEFLNKKPEINAFNLANNPQYNYLSSIKTSSNYAIELAKIENKPNASAFLGARHFAGDNAIAFVGGVSFKVPMGSNHVWRRTPHAEEARSDIIVVDQTAQAVVYRDQVRHVQVQQTATGNQVWALFQAFTFVPDLEQGPSTIEEGLPAVAGPGFADEFQVDVHINRKSGE